MAEDQEGEPRKRKGRRELLSSYLQGKGTGTVGRGLDGPGGARGGEGSGSKDWYLQSKPFPYRRDELGNKSVPEKPDRRLQRTEPRDFRPHGMGGPRVMRHGPDMVVKVGPWARPLRPRGGMIEPGKRALHQRPETVVGGEDGPAPEGPALRDEMIRSMVRRRCEKETADEVTIKEVVERAMALPPSGPRKMPEPIEPAPETGPSELAPVACAPEVEEMKTSETVQEAKDSTPAAEMARPVSHETEDMKVTGPLPPDVAKGEMCPSCGKPVGPRNEAVACTSCGKNTCSECGAYEEVHRSSPIQHDYRFEWPLCYECYMRAFEVQLALARAIMCFGNGNMGYATFYSKKALELGVGSIYEKEIKDLMQTIERYQERSAVYDKHWEKKREHIIRRKFSDPAWK